MANISLPQQAEGNGAQARYENGVLTLSRRKCEATSKNKIIAIQTILLQS